MFVISNGAFESLFTWRLTYQNCLCFATRTGSFIIILTAGNYPFRGSVMGKSLVGSCFMYLGRKESSYFEFRCCHVATKCCNC